MNLKNDICSEKKFWGMREWWSEVGSKKVFLEKEELKFLNFSSSYFF
jgi:hypothetical protein